MRTLNVKAVVIALTTVAAASYVLCAAFQPLFSEWPMYGVTMWQALFPGFSWTLIGVSIGFVWLVGYAIFAGLLYGWAYNFVVTREEKHSANRADSKFRDMHSRA